MHNKALHKQHYYFISDLRFQILDFRFFKPHKAHKDTLDFCFFNIKDIQKHKKMRLLSSVEATSW